MVLAVSYRAEMLERELREQGERVSILIANAACNEIMSTCTSEANLWKLNVHFVILSC